MKASTPRRERDIQTAVLAALRAHGIPCWKVGSGGFRVGERYVRMGQKGMADIIGVQAGRFLAIEVKRPGERPTLEQKAFLHEVQRAGGVAFVAHSVPDVARALGWADGDGS